MPITSSAEEVGIPQQRVDELGSLQDRNVQEAVYDV